MKEFSEVAKGNFSNEDLTRARYIHIETNAILSNYCSYY